MKSTILLIIASLFISIIAFGQTNSTGDGEWSTVVQTSYTIAGGNVVNIQHIVTSDDEINVLLTGTLNIISDSLIVNAGLVTFIGGNVTVNEGAVLYINGNLNNVIAGDITVNGTLKVDGDVSNLGSNVSVGENGYVGVSGDFDNSFGSIDIADGGSVLVGGVFTGNPPSNGDIVLVTPEVALPIELILFNVYKVDNNVNIYWETASEINNDYFTIERSTDGVSYEIIGTVRGAGNSSTTLDYSYTDKNPLNGVSYYRLTQTDYNGDYEVFDPVSVSYLNEDALHIGPNPAVNEINVSLNGEMGMGKFYMYNMSGAQVKSINLESSFTTIDVSNLPSGTYMVVFTAAENQITKRIIIQ